MGRYRKRPVEVEAFHYQGPSPEFEGWCRYVRADGGIQPGGAGVGTRDYEPDHPLVLLTMQGEWVACRVGEWIICESVRGRFYPCAALAFDVTYEPVVTSAALKPEEWR